VAFHRGIDGSDPLGDQPLPGSYELRKSRRPGQLGTGTLACPRCDAPVALAAGAVVPVDLLACPFCDHVAAARDFLSLAAPARPARVAVRVVPRTRRGVASPR
jgi:hypothetical protein